MKAEKGKIIVMNGPSGVGKTSLYKRLLQDFEKDIELSVSATTRKPRPGEQNGKDYYFLTPDQFLEKRDAGEFVEWAQVYGNYYGTLRSEITRITSQGEHILLDIDIQGGENVKKAFPQAILIFILPPSLEELIRRLRDRNTEDEQSFQKRIDTSTREIRFFEEHRALYSYSIINDKLEQAYQDLKKIVLSLI